MSHSPRRRRELELRGPGVILRAANRHTLDACIRDRVELGRTLQAHIPPTWPPPDLDTETIGELRSRLDGTGSGPGRAGWFVLEPGTGLTIPTLVGMAVFQIGASDAVEGIRCILVPGHVAPGLVDMTAVLLNDWEAEASRQVPPGHPASDHAQG
ncbi:MAG: hypothetical protein IT198_07795 [Acidimicrobiia bacterium]|nr:hypothetical protein [Acidimicrobiia bacterium]